jgi:hypothetical protein
MKSKGRCEWYVHLSVSHPDTMHEDEAMQIIMSALIKQFGDKVRDTGEIGAGIVVTLD